MKVSNQVPIGWKKAKLGDIADLVGGGTPSRKKPEYFTGDIIWLTPSQIPKNRISLIADSEEKITDEGLKHSSAKILPEGTVLMTSRASIGYIAIAGTEVTTNQGFASFICRQEIYNWYLAYWLMNEIPQIEQQATGTTFKEISKTKLKNFCIQFPSFDEQKRIVSKIEELFSQLEAGVAGVKRAQSVLKRYRASVLKAAFEGRLVSQNLKNEKFENQDYRLNLFSESNDYSLPKNWIMSSVEDLFEVIGGGTPSTKVDKYWHGDIPWITSADIHGIRDIKPRKHITTAAIEESATNKVPSGSIIVVTRVSLGKVALTDSPLCFSQDSQGLIPKQRSIETEFALHYLSYAARSFKSKSRGTTISGITKKTLKKLPFPVPPLEDQKQIINKIDEIMTYIDILEKNTLLTIQRAKFLKQSILKNAFEGDL